MSFLPVIRKSSTKEYQIIKSVIICASEKIKTQQIPLLPIFQSSNRNINESLVDIFPSNVVDLRKNNGKFEYFGHTMCSP